jgi:subtilisin family serine protease
MTSRALTALVAGASLIVVPTGSSLPAPALSAAQITVGYTAAGLSQASAIEMRNHALRLARIDQLGVDVLEVPAGNLESALAGLRASPGVRYAELDGRVHALRAPNDVLLPDQWSVSRIRAERAWDVTTGSPSVVIAVIDTGVDAGQADLRGKLVPGFDFANNDADPADDNGHGTAVAGVAAASSDNQIGITGFCWQCRLMPVKVLGADGNGYDSAVAQAIVWATDHGARVLNLSLGGPAGDATLTSAAQYAWAHGALVVAAAGNDSSSLLNYPAALPNVVSVGASDENDHLFTFSNSSALLAAPGENTATGQGGGYVSFLGTSSAAPVVSGVAALAFSLVPGASPSQVEQALVAAAAPMPGVARGRVDAYGTLQQLGGAPPAQGAAPDSQPAGRAGSPRPVSGARVRKTTVITGRFRRARTFVLRPEAGILTATIALRRGLRKAVRLRLVGPGGTTVASARGTRRATLQATVRRASYRLALRAQNTAPIPFRLTLSYSPRAS